ncbi:MAG: arsenosugar biosynthesis radical SAM protein ArsS [Planctomycetes bacterium]|nr:arsenosugar biosynthesis radical SAM protein ArsS [Planctomycetota bacterium]
MIAVPGSRLPVDEQNRLLSTAPVADFDAHLERAHLPPLSAGATTVFQVNVGKLCNQRCHHCHVDAGPHQLEANMAWPTFAACLEVIAATNPPTVDITGGAPELNPHFRRFVTELRALGVREIIDRCNLTVLMLPSQQGLAEFLAEHRVRIVASLPAVNQQQTDAQRGDGVFARSIAAIRRLNGLGYGRADSGLVLTLMSNPVGAFLPPEQSSAEARFKKLLSARHDIVFNDLIELTNMPINRYLEYLLASGNYEPYLAKLSAAFNPAAVRGLMCLNTLSVGWDGALYDCDFNQMLELPVAPEGSRTIFTYRRELMEGRTIRTAKHCLGCTAGQGSGCGGRTT